MAMLEQWLGREPQRFLDEDFGRNPCSGPDAAREAAACCDWNALDAMLRVDPAPDILVISRGREVVAPVPRTLAQLHALFAEGIGIVVRHAQRHHAPLQRFCDALAEDVPGEQRVLVFATARGTHGFGWHYDAEEVFIVQTAGRKDYYFRPNTIDPQPVRGAQPDFSRIREETSLLMSCTLLAGDWLYLPRGYWHVALPVEHSLSISVGIFPDEGRGLSPSSFSRR